MTYKLVHDGDGVTYLIGLNTTKPDRKYTNALDVGKDVFIKHMLSIKGIGPKTIEKADSLIVRYFYGKDKGPNKEEIKNQIYSIFKKLNEHGMRKFKRDVVLEYFEKWKTNQSK